MNSKKKYTNLSDSQKNIRVISKIRYFSLLCVRLVLAAVFIFSGFVKAIDPLGSTYKFEDYLSAFGGFFSNITFIAFPAAILLSTFELILGINFLLKIKLKLTSILSLLFMTIMLPLTLYIALYNPVTDCGCFGDALIISNWATFYKNIGITIFVLVILIFHSFIRPLFLKKIEWIMIFLFVLLSIGISIQSYRHLPMIDFRPYKKGVNIVEAMKVPEGKPTDKYETTLIYEKEGIKKEFTIENYPKNDSTWIFVDQKTELVQKGYTPPIHNFEIIDKNQDDITNELLHHNGKVHFIIVYDVRKTSKEGVKKAEQLYTKAKEMNEPFYALTSSNDEDIEQLIGNTGITFPFCKSDPITLKTIIRANPGLMTIENGTIISKLNWRDY